MENNKNVIFVTDSDGIDIKVALASESTWMDMFEAFGNCLKALGYPAKCIDEYLYGEDYE